MRAFFETVWDRMNEAPGHAWQWFNGLSREEWLVVLAIACACGFLSLTGLRSRRL
jgi:hypothetical protein